jgi:hypothetical protein
MVVKSIPRTVTGDGGEPADGQVGTTGPAATDLLLNTKAIDVTQAYVGNGAGAVAPVAVSRGDVDGDGLQDLVCYYDVQAVQVIQAASTLEDGPIGLHYNAGAMDYLVPDIFACGSPILLPAMARTTVTNTGRGTGRLGGGEAPAGDAATQTPAAAAPAAPTPAPLNLPQVTELSRVYPNPFQHDARVDFALAHGQLVNLSVYDLRGARVRTLQSGVLPAGRYSIHWDGADDSGRRLADGMYFVRFHSREATGTRKVALSQ